MNQLNTECLSELSQSLTNITNNPAHPAHPVAVPNMHPLRETSMDSSKYLEDRYRAFEKLLAGNFSISELQAIGAGDCIHDLCLYTKNKMNLYSRTSMPSSLPSTLSTSESIEDPSQFRFLPEGNEPVPVRSVRSPFVRNRVRRKTNERDRECERVRFRDRQSDRQSDRHSREKPYDRKRPVVRYCKEYTLYQHCDYDSCAYHHYTTPEEKKVAEAHLQRLEQIHSDANGKNRTKRKMCRNEKCISFVSEKNQFFCNDCLSQKQNHLEQQLQIHGQDHGPDHGQASAAQNTNVNANFLNDL